MNIPAGVSRLQTRLYNRRLHAKTLSIFLFMNHPLTTSLLTCAIGLSSAQAIDINITSQGALGDGQTLNTLAIQKTIDAVASQGGGKVIVPAGKFVTGTLHLKSHVQLYLAGNAELLGSRSLVDYPKTNPGSGEILAAGGNFDPTGQVLTASEFNGALIVADQQVNVSIAGPGTIDGRGQPDAFPVRITDPVTGKKKLGDRPMLMRFYKSLIISLIINILSDDLVFMAFCL